MEVRIEKPVLDHIDGTEDRRNAEGAYRIPDSEQLDLGVVHAITFIQRVQEHGALGGVAVGLKGRVDALPEQLGVVLVGCREPADSDHAGQTAGSVRAAAESEDEDAVARDILRCDSGVAILDLPEESGSKGAPNDGIEQVSRRAYAGAVGGQLNSRNVGCCGVEALNVRVIACLIPGSIGKERKVLGH